jgi:hypothetical protein
MLRRPRYRPANNTSAIGRRVGRIRRVGLGRQSGTFLAEGNGKEWKRQKRRSEKVSVGAGLNGVRDEAGARLANIFEMLSMVLEDNDELEDQTEAEQATDRLNRLRLRLRQLRQQRRRNRRLACSPPLPYVSRNSGSALRSCLIRTHLHRYLGAI